MEQVVLSKSFCEFLSWNAGDGLEISWVWVDRVDGVAKQLVKRGNFITCLLGTLEDRVPIYPVGFGL